MKKLSWYISLGITFIGFLLINHFFTLTSDEVLGNINPAFIPLVILVPFLFVSLFITFMVGSEYFTNANRAKKIIAFFLAIIIFILAGGTEYQFIQSQIDEFNGNWSDKGSLIYNMSAFNSYTNAWYFNESVFLIIHTVAFLLGIFKKSIITEEQQDQGE